MQETHRIFITLGLVILTISAFLPLGFIVNIPPKDGDLSKFLVKPVFGITSIVYYLNFILLIIAFICSFHRKGMIARIFVILSGIISLISIYIGCSMIGFQWGGPLQGSTGIGMVSMILGNIFILIGCLFQIRFNKHTNQEQPAE